MFNTASSPTFKASAPSSFIIFGASGHLAKLKLYPALYVLALKKRLPEDYCVVGFARSAMNDESFHALVSEAITESIIEVNQKILSDFLDHVHYHQGQYTDAKDFKALAKNLEKIEKGWGKKDGHVRLAYLSIPPAVFNDVLHNICEGNVHTDVNFRCIVEKPVGSDLSSFEDIKKKLLGCFKEEEIYLLDHYLGKEAVRNTYYLRYANPILERLFKNTLIHNVEVSALESAGIEERAGYYESAGAFRDMFQSHLLMMASLLTMHIKDDDTQLQEGRLNALKQFYLPPAGNLDSIVLQGQYAAGKMEKGTMLPAYIDEEGVMKDSRTNTFAAMKLLSRESRWQGVPFYLRSGKRLAKKETRISIQFQEPRSVGQGSAPNRLDIILQGEAGMRVHLQTKVGGTEPAFRPLILEDPLVCVGDCLPEHGLLFLEAIHGRKHWFLTFEEVQTSWRLIDPVLHHLDNAKTPLYKYPAGSHGPEEMNAWIERDGVKWF